MALLIQINSDGQLCDTEGYLTEAAIDFAHHALESFGFLIHAMNSDHVVCEVEQLVTPLLTEQVDKRATSPVQTLPKELPESRKNCV